MRKAIVFDAPREGYAIDQVRRPMTVADLIQILDDCNPEDLVILSHDRGYTYGSLETPSYWEEHEDGEWEEEY